jgi:hypothetical protein
MPAPAFYAIAIAMGALTIGATATDAKRWMGTDHSNSAELQKFYATRFTSPADCLNRAVNAGAPLEACASEESSIAIGPHTMGADREAAAVQTFNAGRFASPADCLNAAEAAGVPLQSCDTKE